MTRARLWQIDVFVLSPEKSKVSSTAYYCVRHWGMGSARDSCGSDGDLKHAVEM